MRITFVEDGWADYCHWVDNPKILKRINRMIDESTRNPAMGIGKPERLSGNLSGYWSRRIDQEHRLVYAVSGDEMIVIAARYHY